MSIRAEINQQGLKMVQIQSYSLWSHSNIQYRGIDKFRDPFILAPCNDYHTCIFLPLLHPIYDNYMNHVNSGNLEFKGLGPHPLSLASHSLEPAMALLVCSLFFIIIFSLVLVLVFSFQLKRFLMPRKQWSDSRIHSQQLSHTSILSISTNAGSTFVLQQVAHV